MWEQETCERGLRFNNTVVNYPFPFLNQPSIIQLLSHNSRSSLLQMFHKINVAKSFAKFTGKHLWWSHIFLKLKALTPATWLKKDFNLGVFLGILWNLKKPIFLQSISDRLLLNFQKAFRASSRFKKLQSSSFISARSLLSLLIIHPLNFCIIHVLFMKIRYQLSKVDLSLEMKL